MLSPLLPGLNLRNAYSAIDKLPFTPSEDIKNKPEEFLTIPKEEIAAYHFTAGTSGARKTIYVSKNDLDLINYSYSLGYIFAEIDRTDVVQIVYSFGIWQLGELVRDALNRIGIVSLPTGNYLDYEEQKNYIEQFGTSVLVGTPSYIHNLAQEINLSQASKKRMKAVLLGGEDLSNTRRKVIEENLGGEVFLNYGLMEVGGGVGSECKSHRGYHIFPSVHLEIIDPKTYEPVGDHEFGEIVLTTLNREAMPLIRYRTGDISRLISGDCDCGLKLPILDYIKGRIDDRITLGTAEKYYTEDFDKLFDDIKDIKDYQIFVTRDKGRDLLKISIATNKTSEDLRRKILEKLYSIPSIQLDVFQTKTIQEPEITFINKFSDQKEKRRRLVDKRESENEKMSK